MITGNVLILGMVVALFAGFVLGWKQCEEKFKRETWMQKTADEIRARAIRDDLLNEDGTPKA